MFRRDVQTRRLFSQRQGKQTVNKYQNVLSCVGFVFGGRCFGVIAVSLSCIISVLAVNHDAFYNRQQSTVTEHNWTISLLMLFVS